MYVNDSNCDSKPFKNFYTANVCSCGRVRGFAWRLSQPGFDPSYGS